MATHLFPSLFLVNQCSIIALLTVSIQSKFMTRCRARRGSRRKMARADDGEPYRRASVVAGNRSRYEYTATVEADSPAALGAEGWATHAEEAMIV